MTDNESNKIDPPKSAKKILLHCCCAPCSGAIIESLVNINLDVTLFFFNPNIHPSFEYAFRKRSIIEFAHKKSVPVIDSDYSPSEWFIRVKGHKNDPERSERCTKCFDFRLEASALYAHENSFPVFTSSFGIARFKNLDQVNRCGLNAAAKYPGLTYWTENWRKNGGAENMYKIAKQEGFYKQKYCGCSYSLKAANEKRDIKGQDPLSPGQEFYS
ncbi:MAG: epoxyqueuosine reductase QueH [Candidatus Omnitrophica bacterium]|nr:epoxyqueuosine reductase QueH [Candidatus Omnitrophota bacterium]